MATTPLASSIASRISDSGVERGGVDLADHAAEIEGQPGLELARQLLHAPVVGQAVHAQQFDAAVARGQQRALQQHGADAVALPFLLDAEGGFRLMGEQRADRPQFAGAAHDAIDKEAMHHDADFVGGGGVAGDEFVRYRAGKAGVAAFRVEPEQMVAIGVGFGRPQFADDAAAGQGFVHLGIPHSSFVLPCLSAFPCARYMVHCSKISDRSAMLRGAGLRKAHD